MRSRSRSDSRSALAFALVAFVFVLAPSACSGESKLGEECDESGKTEDVCESGSVCGSTTTGALICLKVCVDQTNCAATEDCNGVEGTNVKGCKPKTGSGTGTGDGGGTGTGDEDGGKK
jgi:hypothetical protein